MPRIANSHHAEAWNGWEGEIWAIHADRYNAMAEGFNDALFSAAAIRETDRVLDIGCGTGQTTLLAARAAVSGHVVGIDLSRQLLERARGEAAKDGLGNIEFIQGDAQVHPFPAASFDVAISRAALMLFGDLAEGFANIARSLRPGGRIAFTCPGPPNPDSDYARATAALRPFMRRLSPAQQGVSSLSDMQRTRGLLEGAGFTDVTSASIEASVPMGRDAADATDFVFATGPVRYNLDGVDRRTIGRLRDAVRAGFHEFQSPRGIVFRRSDRLVTATRR